MDYYGSDHYEILFHVLSKVTSLLSLTICVSDVEHPALGKTPQVHVARKTEPGGLLLDSKAAGFKLACALKAAILHNPTLEAVSVLRIRLCLPDVVKIAEAVSGHVSLKRLDFTGTQVGDRGVAVLCGALVGSGGTAGAAVNQLVLTQCGLTPKAATPLMTVLKAHRERRDKDLWNSSYVPRVPGWLCSGVSW